MFDFRNFLKNDLNYIKEKLNVKILNQKNNGRSTFLHYLFWKNNYLETFKYVLEFTKTNCPSLFLEKDIHGRTILHYFFWDNNDLETFKYVLDFTKKYPSLFLEKDNDGRTIFHYLFGVIKI